MAEPSRWFLNMTEVQTRKERARVKKANAEAQAEGRDLDVFANYEQALTDAIEGVDRCPECGTIRGRVTPAADKLDIWWDADPGDSATNGRE